MLELTGLKIFQIEDGEQHYIAATTIQEAKNCFLKEMNFDDIQESDLQIREIGQEEDIQVNIVDNDLLVKLINKYRNKKDKTTSINIWVYLKYLIIEKELQDNILQVPFVISSSTFN